MPMKGNSVTWFALAHPVIWTIASSTVVALVGWLLFDDWRPAALGALAMLVVDSVLWRPNGPGRRWARSERNK